MDQQLDQRDRKVVPDRRLRVGVLAGAPEHAADREQRHRRGRIAQHANDLRQRCRQLAVGRGEEGAEGDRPRQRVAEAAAQRERGGGQHRPLVRGARAVAVPRLREGDAHRARDDEVDDDRADHGPGGVLAEKRHQQRHAHEAGVREGGDERAEGGVAQRHAAGPAGALHRDRDRQGDDRQCCDDVDGEQDGIGEAADRQARAEAKQHARQGEEQHVGVEPRDRAFGSQ